MIPYARQEITDKDLKSVEIALKAEFITQGEKTKDFESAISDYCKAKFAIATNSATSALHLACLALGVSDGDTVWTSANTFVASANCALLCGALVDFVDIELNSYNLCPDALEEKLKIASKKGNLPKVIILVHFAGQPCDLHRIKNLQGLYGFKIIEDASHAIGAKYCGEEIGNGNYGDITIFSFHPVKIITTGEGGMCVTNNERYADTIFKLRSNGIIRKPPAEQFVVDYEIWNYHQESIGFNYRLTDFQSALGLSQLGRLDNLVLRRNQIANEYFKSLADLPIILPTQLEKNYSSFHLFPIRIEHLNEKYKSKKIIFLFKEKKYTCKFALYTSIFASLLSNKGDAKKLLSTCGKIFPRNY